MFNFDFMNFVGEVVYTVYSPKQFILLEGDANKCLMHEEICAVDTHCDYIDELELNDAALKCLRLYTAKDAVLIRVDSENDLKAELFSHTSDIQAKLVIYGYCADKIGSDFRKLCHIVDKTGAEPVN